MIVRRERTLGAQLSFTAHDGHRFQAIPSDQTDLDIALIEHRDRAPAGAQIALGDSHANDGRNRHRLRRMTCDGTMAQPHREQMAHQVSAAAKATQSA